MNHPKAALPGGPAPAPGSTCPPRCTLQATFLADVCQAHADSGRVLRQLQRTCPGLPALLTRGRLRPRTDPGARILGVLTGGSAWLLKLWGPGTAWEALHPLLVR